MEEMIMIYITNPSKDRAEELVKHLLSRRLIACANIFDCDSMYWAEGFIEKDTEVIIVAKTIESNFNSVRKMVEDTSDYQVPCIIKIPVSVNGQYAQWMRSEVRS